MTLKHLVLSAVLAVPLAGAPLVSAAAETAIRIANSGEPDSVDPHYVSGTWENRIVGAMFLGLTTEAPDASVVPGAAESWTVSDDGTVYTFTLRDHNWSDGTPVTAGDFVFSLRRILDPETAAAYASLLYPIKNAEALNSGEMTGMESLGARAINDKTLEITLKAPTPYFIELLTHYTTFPVPKHVVEAKGNDWIKPDNIAVNGPYKLAEWVPNTEIKLVKNPAYYDADSVSIDSATFYPAEDRAAALKRFRAGEIDLMTDFASDQIDWLRENLPDETRISPYLGIYYYPVNTNRPPFDDVRVRQALSMAIDRETIMGKVMRTGEVSAYSFVPPGTGNYGNPAFVDWMDKPQDERVEQAKALLAEAGFGPDKPLEFTLRYNTSENHKKIAIAVAAMWKKVGVKAELFNAEVKVHYNDLQENDFDVARAGWIADYNDAQNFLYLLQTSTGRQNYGRYSNAEFDRLMDEASVEADLDKRSALMKDAEAIAMGDQPIIPIYYYVSKNLVAQHVKGWVANTKDIHRIRYLSIEK